MRKLFKFLSLSLIVVVFAIVLCLIFEDFNTLVKADTGAPVSITASYNSSTGQLNTSGFYAWEECEPGEETNILGFALFINDGNPATNDSNALEGAGIHLANSGNPCTTTPDNWADNNHVLSSAPTNVCVVIYDVRSDDSADPGGIHSLIGAGGNYNTDNSWSSNGNSFPKGSCATPEIVTPTPTPRPDVCENIEGIQTEIPNGQHLDASGLNCVNWSESGPAPRNDEGTGDGGQVLGTSTMAATGSFTENLYMAIMGVGAILTLKGAKNFKKAFKKS